MDFTKRVAVHAALGEPHRLAIVDALGLTDLTFSDLCDVTGLDGNALAHHLQRLEDVGLVTRRPSEGDRRRRYLRLDTSLLDVVAGATAPVPHSVVFVCTHNSARSQFAAARWHARTGLAALSVGSDPAASVHPLAVDVASEFGLDLSAASPRGYESLSSPPDLVVSVCDRANEGGVPAGRSHLHWSTPDPVRTGERVAFRKAFADLAKRIDVLVDASDIETSEEQ